MSVEFTAAQLRGYYMLQRVTPQFASYFSAPVRSRGYPLRQDQSSLFIEVAPALFIQGIVDFVLRSSPEVEPGLVAAERQFGVAEFHAASHTELLEAGSRALEALNLDPESVLKQELVYLALIEKLTDRHAILVNRDTDGQMLLPGDSLLLAEVRPASLAAKIANAVLEEISGIDLVEMQIVGATGRLYLRGRSATLSTAEDLIRKTFD